jgi:tetratricopeptide (TPR) repeat protein
MPPRTLLARMSERFRLLASSGGRPDRQATMRGALDWSWELLTHADKAALAQLSVFEGGFTLEAAEAVLDLSQADASAWALDALQSLVDKSLLRRDARQRFAMLATVQEYAAEHLRGEGRFPGSGPAALRAAEARHGAYYATFDEQRAIADHCIELDNLVASCRRAAARGDAPTAVGALQGAWAALRLRGPFGAGVALAAVVDRMPALAARARALVGRVGADAMQSVGQPAEARARLEAALVLARGAGDRRCETQVLIQLGELDADQGRMETAREHLGDALALARQTGDRLLECDARGGLGTLHGYLGELDTARGHYEGALALARELDERRREGGLLGNLGLLDANQGRMETALARFNASLAVAREVGDRRWEGNALCNLGLVHHVSHRLPEARTHLQAGLSVAREIGHVRLESVVLCNLGLVHAELGPADDARAYFEQALLVARDLDDRRSQGQVLGYLGLLHAKQGRADEAQACFDAGEALLSEMSDRISLGVLLCARAQAEQLAGRERAAQAALERAEALASGQDVGPDSEFGTALALTRAALHPT